MNGLDVLGVCLGVLQMAAWPIFFTVVVVAVVMSDEDAS